jgi:DNA-binding MarR family transcriptional regulator
MVTHQLLQLIYAAHKELSRIEQEPRDYGTGRLFYASEIHTLVCIGENPYLNLTTLAEKLEVSKSAASKFVKKLIAAACIEKTKSPDNAKDVLFHASLIGKRAIQGHKAFEEMMFGPLQAIESRLSLAEAELVSSFLTELNDELMKNQS